MTIIAMMCIVGILLFPTFMICITYPLSKKWALFWSNWITRRTDRLFFAILKCYTKYRYIENFDNFEKLPEQFLVISNHQSLLDIVVYLRYFRGKEVRFVAKDTLSMVPMVGKMLKSQGHCMIPRKGGAGKAMRSLEAFGKRVLEKKQMPVIFPEGTRSRTGELGSFYAAGFRRLEETVKLPVAVCALDGGWQASRLNDIVRNLCKGFYRVKLLDVLPAPENKEEEQALLEKSKSMIQKQLDEWRKLP